MAIDISSISNLIREFRLLQARDSVSPDNLGYLLDKVIELLDGMPDSDDLDALRIRIAAAELASGSIASLSELMGRPNGLATLDSSGKLSRQQRPDGLDGAGTVGDIIRFGAFIDTAPECAEESYAGDAGADNVIVVYDDGTERFMIGVCRHPVADGNWKTPYYGSLPVGKPDNLAAGATASVRHLWYINAAGFVCLNDELFDFYSWWDGADKIGESCGDSPCTPIPGRLYVATNGIFSTCGHALAVMTPSYQSMWLAHKVNNLETRVQKLEQCIVVQ